MHDMLSTGPSLAGTATGFTSLGVVGFKVLGLRSLGDDTQTVGLGDNYSVQELLAFRGTLSSADGSASADASSRQTVSLKSKESWRSCLSCPPTASFATSYIRIQTLSWKHSGCAAQKR